MAILAPVAMIALLAGPASGAPSASRAAGAEPAAEALRVTVERQQAGRAADAVAAFEAARAAEPPEDALLAATRAYRDLQRFGEAERLARQGLARFPAQPVWPLLLALVLSDAGRPAEALAVLAGPAALRAPPLERKLAEGYAWRRAGEPFKALSAYSDALALAPGNDEAQRAAGELLAAEADKAAAMVRSGSEARPADPAHRFDGTDAAIARLDQLLAATPAPNAALQRRLRLDRLVAYRDRVRMAEVVQEGEALSRDAALPPYAEQAYADALLYLRRPMAARDAYRRVLAADPRDLSAAARLRARYGVFYASVEVEDFETAYATIDALLSDQTARVTNPDGSSPAPDPDRAFAELTAANARLYGNQLADAWTRLTGLVQAAPANPTARMALSSEAQARGWPRRADVERHIAISLAPESFDARVAGVEGEIAGHRYDEARQGLDRLLAEYPESVRLQRMSQDLDAIRGWAFELEVRPSDSDGGGANATNRAVTLQTRLTSPALADRWRVFLSGDYENAHPPEGYVDRTRIGVGAEWRGPYLGARVYASENLGALQRAGAGAGLDWAVSDRFAVGVAGELYSWDTPLRAILQGITANTASARVTYRWNEARSLSATVGYEPFSDGNRRYNASLTLAQALVRQPHLSVTAQGEVYVSDNTRPDAPYFNPDHDLTADVGLLAEHMIWRRYQASLVQALTVNAGVYEQAHFPTDWIGTAAYEHRWRFDPRIGFDYGVSLARRVYDGAPEQTWALFLRLARRF